MDLAILSNHVYPFHVGGSETVIKNVSEELVIRGHTVTVYGCDAINETCINGVKIMPCRQNDIASIINKHEKIMIYSDSFIFMSNVLRTQSVSKKSICLFPVGMNNCIANSSVRCQLLLNKKYINFICHDDSYVDALFLKENKISFKVIPNGINSKEFSFSKRTFGNNSIKKILCVANTFPKKGHLELIKVCEYLSKLEKIELHFCSHTPRWNVGARMQSQLIALSSKMSYPIKWHVDLKREELISKFYEADVFALCSLKEVAPICILESCGAGLPWMSFNVGNVSKISGGKIVESSVVDKDGYLVVGEKDFKNYSEKLLELLKNSEELSRLSDEALNYSQNFCWNKIVEKYEQYI